VEALIHCKKCHSHRGSSNGDYVVAEKLISWPTAQNYFQNKYVAFLLTGRSTFSIKKACTPLLQCSSLQVMSVLEPLVHDPYTSLKISKAVETEEQEEEPLTSYMYVFILGLTENQ
jgi:hypothetical protein